MTILNSRGQPLKPRPFCRLPAEFIHDPGFRPCPLRELTPREQRLLLALLLHGNDLHSDLSIDTMARILDCSRRTVDDCMNGLMARGLVAERKVVGRHKRTVFAEELRVRPKEYFCVFGRSWETSGLLARLPCESLAIILPMLVRISILEMRVFEEDYAHRVAGASRRRKFPAEWGNGNGELDWDRLMAWNWTPARVRTWARDVPQLRVYPRGEPLTQGELAREGGVKLGRAKRVIAALERERRIVVLRSPKGRFQGVIMPYPKDLPRGRRLKDDIVELS